MTQDARSHATIEVANRLGVLLQTGQRWVDAGRLKAWKTLGGHRRIEPAGAESLFKEPETRRGAIDSTLCSAQPHSLPLPTIAVVVVDFDAGDRDAYLIRLSA